MMRLFTLATENFKNNGAILPPPLGAAHAARERQKQNQKMSAEDAAILSS
jgi:hypothetical protein